MAMHQGLDLSRFRRVSADKKTTILRHAKGHEIKVAHSGLTPKMRAELEALPEADSDEVKRYAEGTPDKPVSKKDGEDAQRRQPAPVDVQPPVQAQSLSPTPVAPSPSPQESSLAPTPTPQPTPQPQARPEKPEVMPVAGEVNIVGQRPAPPQPSPQQVAQDMTNHDLAFQRDMAMGHIKPETYHDLFAKKDTLGKIGTLFGMLVGGAGAGLTKQPNAIMEMMNKEIQNDFEAQQKSQGNAQTWSSMSKNYELQKAQMQQMDYQNALTMGQLSKVPFDIEAMKAQTENTKANAALTWSNQALNRMKMAAVQSLQDQVNNIPPGPQKDAALKGLDLLSNAVQKDVETSNLKTADQMAARDKLRSATKVEANDPGVDLDKFNHMIAQSRANESIGAPSLMNESDIAKATQEATEVADNRATAKIYDDSFRKLNKAFAAGALNPQLRAAMLASLGAEIARATAGRFNAAEAAAQADGMFPSVKDWGGARDAKYQKAMEYFESQEAGTTTLNRLGLKKPFPMAVKKKTDGKYKEGAVAKNKNGERVMMKGGKWIPMGATKQATK